MVTKNNYFAKQPARSWGEAWNVHSSRLRGVAVLPAADAGHVSKCQNKADLQICVTMVLRLLRGILFCVLIFLSSFLGATFFAGWSMPILFIRPPLYRILMDSLIDLWKGYCAALLELVGGIKVVISGDEVKPGEKCLLIMNHRTRLDWMYFWSVLVRQSGVKREKIILKAPLKHIPGAGWAMQVGTFIFIHRKWEVDRQILDRMLDYFRDLKYNVQVLLFPEGTDLTPKTRDSSNRFADKSGLPHYTNVLHPRTTGFSHIVQHMRKGDMLDTVYDVTVGYPYSFPTKETDLLKGKFPEEVHFNLKRYSAKDLPESSEGLADWCQERWGEKEEQLEKFYKNKTFTQNGPLGSARDSHGRNPNVMLWTAAIYWTLFVLGILVILYYSWFARWFLLFQIIFYLIMGLRNGFEGFQVQSLHSGLVTFLPIDPILPLLTQGAYLPLTTYASSVDVKWVRGNVERPVHKKYMLWAAQSP